MPLYKVDAIVLRRTELGETDRILRLLTRQSGRIDAVAKGARRGSSKLSGATELFTHCRMLLATGKSLDIVSQCEIKESFPRLRARIDTIARATYLCELVDRLVGEREPNPDAFDLLLSALFLLQRAISNPDVIVHAFELRLLAERGYQPVLDHCVRCGGKIPGTGVGFSPSLGGALCAAHSRSVDDSISVKAASIVLCRRLLESEPQDLVTLSPSTRELQEVARCLKWYIRFRTDRDLRSAEFVDLLRIEQRT